MEAIRQLSSGRRGGARRGALEIGAQGRFEVAMGETGPQATTVQMMDKSRQHVPERESEEWTFRRDGANLKCRDDALLGG